MNEVSDYKSWLSNYFELYKTAIFNESIFEN